MFALLRSTPSLRRFFAAFFQSQLGNGAASVALLVLVYHRLHSSWAISLVLLGDFLPGIVLTPVFGSLADRCSRRRLAVLSDLLRASCFVAIAVVPSFTETIVFVLLAGVGTAMFRPAISAALPSMVDAENRSQLTAMFYGSLNLAMMLGPLLSALLLLVVSAPVVLIANALTFAISAALLATVKLGPERGHEEDEPETSSVWAETRAGARAVAQLPAVPHLMAIAALVVLTGAMFNVLAPLLANGPLHAGASGYSLLMTLYGAGMVAGSWVSARAGTELSGLRRRWVLGIALSGVAMGGTALAPSLGVALFAFALIGLGENLLVTPETRLMQELVPARLHGRAFGLKDVLDNLAFALAFVGAGALAALFGTRPVFLGTGLLTLGLSLVGAAFVREGSPAAGNFRRRWSSGYSVPCWSGTQTDQ